VSSMSDIVWAINPKKDSLLELVRRMRSFGEETLEQKEISVVFNAPQMSDELKLDADIRRNVFLIFKESINNIVRHSRAEKVNIDLEIFKHRLILSVSDDGAGFDSEGDFDGNGLHNIKRRAAELKGNLTIVSARNNGSKLILEVPLDRQF